MTFAVVYNLLASFFQRTPERFKASEGIINALPARLMLGPSCEEMVGILTVYTVGAIFGTRLYWQFVATPLCTIVYTKINFIPA